LIFLLLITPGMSCVCWIERSLCTNEAPIIVYTVLGNGATREDVIWVQFRHGFI